MIVTLKKLQTLGACQDAVDKYFIEPNRKAYKAKELLELAISNKDWSMAQWGLSRLMTHKQQITWAIYCAEQVIKIYEEKYPADNRPRLAIAAAKKYLKNPTDENKAAAYAAADAAYAAAYAAADAADAAAYAAADAAYAAAYEKMQIKLLHKGLQILEAK